MLVFFVAVSRQWLGADRLWERSSGWAVEQAVDRSTDRIQDRIARLPEPTRDSEWVALGPYAVSTRHRPCRSRGGCGHRSGVRGNGTYYWMVGTRLSS